MTARADSDPPADRPVLDAAALYGLAGDVVKTILPYTEADAAGLLFSFLTMFGNCAGPQPFIELDGIHPARLFCALVGLSEEGRKGTAMNAIKRLFKLVDPEWHDSRIKRGIQSAEGLISRAGDGEDNRLMIQEGEFAWVLRTTQQRGTLSPMLINAWDGEPLEVNVKSDKGSQRVVGAHISILAGITPGRVTTLVTPDDIEDGFANRLIYPWVAQSKWLGNPGVPAAVLESLAGRVREAVEAAPALAVGNPIDAMLFRYHGRPMPETEAARTDDYRDRWWSGPGRLYGEDGLLRSTRPVGVAGDIIKRRVAHVTRIALIFALLDLTSTVDRHHLDAAWACMRYLNDSAVRIWGSATGNRHADKVLSALKSGRKMSRTEIHREVFSGNKSLVELDAILAAVMATGRVMHTKEGTGNRKTNYYQMKTGM